MGIISRRVIPACGSLCICCPELRARSRQPVKRYKKLMTDIFPKTQDELPNDRKIGKLTEYASKNPLRIPKIADALEQRGYKELRNERDGTVRVVMRAYSRLLVDCRDQMPLFATSCLGMIKALLDQVRKDDLRILGCLTLVDFLHNQTDSTYMRNLDAFLPKLCALAHETGEESRRSPLRAAGLQAIAAVVTFMGKYSHIYSEFEDIVAVILDNYEMDVADLESDGQENGVESNHNWVQEVLKGEGRNAVAAVKGAITKLYSTKESSRFKDPSTLNKKETQLPKIWSQICVQNLARLCKEATTVRRILDPMFSYFDSGRHWSPEQGLAIAVLRDMQIFMDKSGNEQLFLPMLVRHLDHKTVGDQPALQANIVEIIGNLARHSKSKATVADIGAMNDLLKHLRKSIEFTVESSTSQGFLVEDHRVLQTALEECLSELVKRVGDTSAILDMMGSNLEKLSGNPIIARTTMDTLAVLARCVGYAQDQSFSEQLFPEALFQQILHAMNHPDVETRVRAHHIFALLLVPASVAPESDSTHTKPETSNMLTRTSSVFSSAAALFEKLRKEKYGSGERETQAETWAPMEEKDDSSYDKVEGVELKRMGSTRNKDESLGTYLSPSRLFGFKASVDRAVELSLKRSTSQRRSSKHLKDIELTGVRLSGHQAALVLSVLWIEACLPDNLPSNFEAIAHTFMLTLLFSRAKTSSHSTITRAFQLALSLRGYAVDFDNNQLPPSRRRSLFTLASAMLILAAQAYSISELIPKAKAPLTATVKDPYLDLVEDLRLKIVSATSSVQVKDYGSAIDDHDALKALSSVSLTSDESAGALVALVVQSSALTEAEDHVAATEQMLHPFIPEEAQGFGSHLFLATTPHSHGSPAASRDGSLSFDEIIAYTGTSLEEEVGSDNSAGELPRLLANVPVSILPQHAIGVSQLLEAALETAGQVACASFPESPLSYSMMASQCEAFGIGSRKKISSVLRLEAESSSMRLTLPDKDRPSRYTVKDDLNHSYFQDMEFEHPAKDTEGPNTPLLKQNILQDISFSPGWLKQPATSPEPWQVFRLPPASPYDNFLKAACY